MADSAILTAADYAEALITARRAKNIVVLVLALVLLGQLGLFFAAKYSDKILPAVDRTIGTSLDLSAATQPTASKSEVYHYLIGLSMYLGTVLSVVLVLVTLLLAMIMLVGRLIGVGKVTGAFVTSLLLLVLFFPWQAALFGSENYILPGVLYSWSELRTGIDFDKGTMAAKILGWARFVGWPVVALILLVVAQVKSSRGVAIALGESDIVVDIHTAA